MRRVVETLVFNPARELGAFEQFPPLNFINPWLPTSNLPGWKVGRIYPSPRHQYREIPQEKSSPSNDHYIYLPDWIMGGNVCKVPGVYTCSTVCTSTCAS